jgi:hypothetical protein
MMELTPYNREKIVQLEEVILSAPEAHVTLEPKNHFADGIYLRELFIPAGVIVTGKIHRTRHMTIIASGTVRITTDSGIQEITGPAVFVSEPGIKKAAYAITDTVVMNPHPTESTDLIEIENKFIAPSFEAIEQERQVCLG